MHYTCSIHRNNSLTHFCQTCSDAICKDCFTRQPHSGFNCQVKTLQESANIRKNHYVNYLNTQINPLRKRMQQRLSDLSGEQKKYEVIKQVIEKDISIEYQTIENRLSQKIEKIVYSKQTQIKHYQLFINKLDDLVDAYEKCFQNPQAFLLAYQMFDTQIRKLQSLQKIKSQQNNQSQTIHMNRQISETYQKIKTIQKHQKNNTFMNQLINQFIKNYKKQLNQQQAKAYLRAKQIKLFYNQKTAKLVKQKNAKVCVFCGAAFSLQVANQGCPNNRTFKIKTIYPQIDFDSIIPDDQKGSKRHFWYKSGSQHRKRPDMKTHSLIRQLLKKHYLNSLSELQELKYILDKYKIEEGKDIQQLFKTYDDNKNGFITKIAFTYIMNKQLNVPKQQIQSLINLLSGQKGIQYMKIRKLIENPTQDYVSFVNQQQQIQKSKPVGPNSGTIFSKFLY